MEQETIAAEQFPLTDKCHHYERISEVPWDIQKSVLILLL
jgi:hypothetical protein